MENYVLFFREEPLPVGTFPASGDDEARAKARRIVERKNNKNIEEYLLFRNISLSDKVTGADNQQGSSNAVTTLPPQAHFDKSGQY